MATNLAQYIHIHLIDTWLVHNIARHAHICLYESVQTCPQIPASCLILSHLPSRVMWEHAAATIPHHHIDTNKGMQWSKFIGSLCSRLIHSHRIVILRHLEAGKSAYKICLFAVSPYLHFFLWPCRIGRDVCNGDWDALVVWFLITYVFFYA